MRTRDVCFSIILGAGAMLTPCARADSAPTTPTVPAAAHKHVHVVQFALDHATALGLTADQTTKLQALEAKIQAHHAAKPAEPVPTTAKHHHHHIMEALEKILTVAQMEKLHKLIKQSA